MKYKVLIERYAQKQIMKLDRKIIPVIKASIIDIAGNPRPYGYKKLKGEEAYRIRVGNYHVNYLPTTFRDTGICNWPVFQTDAYLSC